MIRHVLTPAVITAQASTTAITATRTVGVPGQAWPVRPRARLMIQRSPKGGTRTARQRRSDPGGEPGQSGPGGKAPAESAGRPRSRLRCLPGSAPVVLPPGSSAALTRRRMAWSVSYRACSAPTRLSSTGMPSLSPVLIRYLPRPGWRAPGCQESGADQEVTSSCSGPVSGVISSDAGELARRQPAQDRDGAPFDEAAGLGPVGLGRQGVQVGERVGDHDRAHPLGPVEPGQAVGVLDQARGSAQRPPQLVHHREVRASRAEVLARPGRPPRRPSPNP